MRGSRGGMQSTGAALCLMCSRTVVPQALEVFAVDHRRLGNLARAQGSRRGRLAKAMSGQVGGRAALLWLVYSHSTTALCFPKPRRCVRLILCTQKLSQARRAQPAGPYSQRDAGGRQRMPLASAIQLPCQPIQLPIPDTQPSHSMHTSRPRGMHDAWSAAGRTAHPLHSRRAEPVGAWEHHHQIACHMTL